MMMSMATGTKKEMTSPWAVIVHSARSGRENKEAKPRSEARPSYTESTHRRHVNELA